MTLELKNITTVVNPGTDEEKKILKNLSLSPRSVFKKSASSKIKSVSKIKPRVTEGKLFGNSRNMPVFSKVFCFDPSIMPNVTSLREEI